MHRYYEDVAGIKLMVEFDQLDSPRIAIGTIQLIPNDPELARIIQDAAMTEKIIFEYREQTGKLDIFVDDKWQTKQWFMPVLVKLADVTLRAITRVGIAPKSTYV